MPPRRHPFATDIRRGGHGTPRLSCSRIALIDDSRARPRANGDFPWSDGSVDHPSQARNGDVGRQATSASSNSSSTDTRCAPAPGGMGRERARPSHTPQSVLGGCSRRSPRTVRRSDSPARSCALMIAPRLSSRAVQHARPEVVNAHCRFGAVGACAENSLTRVERLSATRAPRGFVRESNPCTNGCVVGLMVGAGRRVNRTFCSSASAQAARLPSAQEATRCTKQAVPPPAHPQ